MPKDNEIVPHLDVGPTQAAPLRSFTPDKMIRCESCLRANPPTRVVCLYCGHSLPVLPSSSPAQQPALRPLEKWEHGYNNILLASAANAEIPAKDLAEFFKLTEEEVQRIVSAGTAMPLARCGNKQEAQLIQQRLESMGLSSVIVADEDLGLDPFFKLRAADFHDDSLDAYQSRDIVPVKLLWNDFVLMVDGRITRRRIELTEERKRKEKRVVGEDQFYDDENIIEFYTNDNPVPYRITSGSFDFSCLGPKKSLLAAENMSMLMDVFRQRVPRMVHDPTYNSLRKALDPVWKADQQNDSTGWRRARPGKFSLGSATETSNESQFSRYSRLRYYLLAKDLMTGANA